MEPHPFLDHGGPIPFAHRGGASAAPENTLAAFADAVALGYRHVETDVHATRDAVLLAFHDGDLSRSCGDPRRIAEHTADELSTARVDGSEPIPRLEEILDTWPDLHVNIDCKADSAVAPLVALLQRRPALLDRVCIGSFSDARLDALRRAVGPALLTSMGPRAVARLVGRSNRLPLGLRGDGARCAQVPMRQGPLRVVTPRFVDTAHRAGIQVHVWTVDEPSDIASLLDMGVDGIMSDDTRALRSVMVERGVWFDGPDRRGDER